MGGFWAAASASSPWEGSSGAREAEKPPAAACCCMWVASASVSAPWAGSSGTRRAERALYAACCCAWRASAGARPRAAAVQEGRPRGPAACGRRRRPHLRSRHRGRVPLDRGQGRRWHQRPGHRWRREEGRRWRWLPAAHGGGGAQWTRERKEVSKP
jgi:hypothetical protein